MPGTSSARWVFGPFTLHGDPRGLVLRGSPIEMAREHLDVLAALIDQAPQDVHAADLLSCLPPGHRDGGTLWLAVSAINEILKTGSAIHYLAQTGAAQYQFMGPVARLAAGGFDGTRWTRGGRGGALREPVVVGRAIAIGRIRAQVSAARLVTVTGAGGMGKTTVAHAVAAGLGAGFVHGACLVDLAPLASADALPQSIAASLGMVPGGPDLLQALTDFVFGRQMLLVLDNCEHLVAAVAHVAEQLLVAPGLHILCTSREPLRARGEQVYQLQPMEVPRLVDGISAPEAARYSAVQMFLQATRSGSGEVHLSDGNAAVVSAICQRLDGIPLALELAAAHAGALGVEQLAAQLHDTVLTLPVSDRSLHDRHRTLEATLDWSHSLLDAAERAVLRRVSVFRSAFPLDSAVRVAADHEFDECRVVEALLGLTAKSLMHALDNGDGAHYRLLDTTRTYAACKLQAAPELSATRMRYAQDCCERLQRAEALWESTPAPAWMLRYGPLMQDARCGLDWATGEPGTERIALHLLLASVALAGRMSLLEEYSARIRKGLEHLRASADPDPVLQLQLTSALTALMLHQNVPAQDIEDISEQVQRLATEFGDDRFGAVAGTALWMSSLTQGNYPRATLAADRQLQWAQRQGDASLVFDAQRQVAYCRHFMGQQAQAMSCALELLRVQPLQTRVSAHTINQIDYRVAMRIVLARSQWVLGLPVQALQTIREAVDIAESDRPTALCQALAFGGCQIALWNGDHTLAAQWSERLDRFAATSKLTVYRHWAAHFGVVLAVREGRSADTSALASLTPMQHDSFATIDPSWAGSDAVARVEQGLVHWCAPEVRRAHGELLLRSGAAPDMVEQQWRDALILSREQGALAWELRAATSLARLAHGKGARAQARDLLEPVYLKFREGFDTRDLHDARELLQRLS